MAIDLNLADIGSGYNRTPINNNFDAIVAALEDAFSLSGVSPNSLNTDLDLNDNDLLNVNDGMFTRIFVDGTEITGASQSRGYAGWSPSLAAVSDGTRRVFQLVEWIGGEGDIPTDHVGEYLGTGGFVTDIASATDVRGPQGATGPGSGDLVAAQNLSDVDNAATSFNNIKQTATTSSSGVLEVATASEAVALTSSTHTFTPLVMANFFFLGEEKTIHAPVSVDPTGWLIADGRAVSRTTYSAYFALVGTTYGAGDGSTTFNIPDLRGRVSAGKDNMGGTSANRLTGISGSVNGDNLGAAGGEEGHVLTVNQLALHGHPFRTHNSGGDTTNPPGGFMVRQFDGQINHPAYTGSVSGTSGEQIGGTGGNEAHNTVQPTIIANKLIFVGV